MSWPTFWLEPDGTVALGLRRYRHDWDSGGGAMRWECGYGWHQAMTWRGELAPERFTDEHGHRAHATPELLDHADPRWPQACAGGCGYRFLPSDEWQEWEEPVYTGPGNARYVLHTGWPPPPGMLLAGAGATWDAWWLPGDWLGVDGIGLMVRCPRPDGTPGSNDWPVDSPATGGGTWTRTGDPRQALVTVTPSIAIGEPGQPGFYHGFLGRDTPGVLTDHIG
jgi:hypothetical protein